MNDTNELIGEGRVSNVFLRNGFAYKTFPLDYPVEWIEHEVRISTEVSNKTDLLVPKMSLVPNLPEIEMDYIEGCTLGERMRKEKYKHALEDLIEIQLSIYKYHDLELAQCHIQFEKQLKESNLDELLIDNALSALQKIEVKNQLCHFDLHFLNLIYSNNEYYIIDWVNAMLANPVLDVARTFIILKQYAPRIANKYLRLITSKVDFNKEEVEYAIIVMATLRLLENDVTPFKEMLLELTNPK